MAGKVKHPEHDQQVLFFKAIDYFGFDAAKSTFAVPNGARFSSVRHGALMKAEGMRRGVPDIICLVANHGNHGLAIEMKSDVGRQTPEQKDWQIRLEKGGYKYAVCRSSKEAFEVWAEYNDIRNEIVIHNATVLFFPESGT